ncbi:MAG TPA: vWA domain-containing protein [Dehalococcoidia bacterium]|nr:vWA domain-containing protein [Dehalococcoidia bacterium]
MKLMHQHFNFYRKLPRTAISVPRMALLMALLMAGLAAIIGSFWTPGLARAQEPEASGVTVILVVDDSRSMLQTDPGQRRGLGGRLLIERLFPEDRIATVLFSRQARMVATLTEVQSDENRDSLKSSLSLLRSSGSTDMLDALTEAFAELERDSTENPKLVVFLTDGRLLLSEAESAEYSSALADLLRAYRANEWPVFPISFGRAADAGFMSHIAEVTGGETCDAPTDTELAACFQTVLDQFKETELVLQAPPRCLGIGETADYPVYVDPYAKQLSVVTASEDSQEDFSGRVLVLNPDGSSGDSARQEGTFRFYNFGRPAEGTWTVRFTGPGCFGESFAYIQSDVRVALNSPGRVHAAGPSVEVRAAIEGRRAGGDWVPVSGELVLAATSPEGVTNPVDLSGQQLEHVGRLENATRTGDYRLMFEATVGFADPRTGQRQERAYRRQQRVEIVEAPALEASIDGETIHRILPGDSVNITGRITPFSGLRSPVLSASFSGNGMRVDLDSSGVFSGTVIPPRAGTHTLEVSLESTLTGRYGEVRYPASSTQTITVEFDPLELEVARKIPGDLNPGEPASLIGRVWSKGGLVEIDQSAWSLELTAPGQNLIQVEMTVGDVPGEYHGTFVPQGSGVYTLSGIDTAWSRSGVSFSAEEGQKLEISLRPALEVDAGSIMLGQLYPGEVVTRRLLVSNNSNQDLSLTPRTGTADLAVELSPALIQAGADRLPVQVQFQVGSESNPGGGELLANLSLDPGSPPAVVIPMTYEIGDFFVGLKDREKDLGFLGKGDRTIPVQLALGYNSPVPVKVSAAVTDSAGETIIGLNHDSELPLLLSGAGDETVTLLLPLPENIAPGAYQGSIHIISDPPIPVRPTGGATFSYRLPSVLESWVLDHGWWVLSATAVVFLISLTGWGGLVTQRINIQGRLLIYDREGMARLRRVDLRRFGRSIVTIGTRADLSLRDSSGSIDPEHAQIVATRGRHFPRVYPMGAARVVGQFGQDVDSSGVPLGDGDTFSVGRYNLEWSATWANSRLGRLLGDPWWKLGFLLALAVIGLVAGGFYLVLM